MAKSPSESRRPLRPPRVLMRTLCYLFAGLALSCSVTDPQPAPVDIPEPNQDPAAEPPRQPMGNVLRWQKRVGAGESIPHGTLYRAALAHQSNPISISSNHGPTNWTQLGPGNVGGRIRSILIHPTNPATMWVGSVGGGLWKTTDAGNSWSMLPDLPTVLAISCMILDPGNPDVMFAGTGEECFFNNIPGSSNSAVQHGAGVFKSADGGQTWTQLPATNTAAWNSVSRLEIDPNSPLTMLASTISGLWRSTDGGTTWSQRTTGNTLDVQIDPNDSSKYVAGRADGKAQFSTDGGVTWNDAPTFANTTRVEVEYAESSPGMVYAATSTGRINLWRSTDGGQTYSPRASGIVSTLSNYDIALWADPTNSNRVVVGGLDAYRSTNAGQTFRRISRWSSYPRSAHADQHILVEHPGFDGAGNSVVYFGNDGGIQRADNVFTVGTTVGWTNLANDLAITQFYGACINPTTGVVLAGAQDNGTSRGIPANGLNGWTSSFGGDGCFCAADPDDPNYFYFQAQNLLLRRSSDGGSTNTAISSGINERTPNFCAYILLDPNDSDRLYACGAGLWRTNNAKANPPTWNLVKTPLLCPTATAPGPRPSHFANNPPCNISTVAVAPGNPSVIWVGHNNGDVYRTTNGLASSPTWTKVDDQAGGLPDRWVSRIAIDHNDPTRVTLSLMGFAPDNIWQTTDSGATWNSRVGSGAGQLPAVPVSCLVQHRVASARFYAATDLGLFFTEDNGASWSAASGGPSIVSMDELIWKNDRTLLVATHGRSMWTCDVDPAEVRLVGTGCGATAPPSLVATPPVIGSTQFYTLANTTPNAQATLMLARGLPSPMNFGACTLEPAIPLTAIPLGTTDSQGNLAAQLSIPSGLALIGQLATVQAFVVAPSGPLLGVGELTNGAVLTFGF